MENLTYSQHLSMLIKNSEERIVFYKKTLEDVNKNKLIIDSNFGISQEELDKFTVWFKLNLRELKNKEEKDLKELVEEKTYYNQGLNPPSFYKNWKKQKKLSSVIVHPHPIVEMKLNNDLITIKNLETNEIESDFYLNEIIAQEIIDLMNNYLNK